MKRITLLAFFILASIVWLLTTSCISKSDPKELITLSQNIFRDLFSPSDELQNTGYRLSSYPNNISSLRNSLPNVQSQLMLTQVNKSLIRTNIDSAPFDKNVLNQPKTTLDDLSSITESLQLNQDVFGAKVFSGLQPPYVGKLNQAIILNGNPAAANVSWQQLQLFITANQADKQAYIPDVYACGDFAKQLFNDAENSGIRAGFVVLHFSDGTALHALNAFLTTDRGLVFVDCTGGQTTTNSETELGQVSNWDKIAYVKLGKPLGVVSMGTNYGTNYADYEKWLQDRQSFDSLLLTYNKKVQAYNNQVAGSIEMSMFEYTLLMNQRDGLINLEDTWKKLAKQLGYLWEPQGVVSSIEIYWQ